MWHGQAVDCETQRRGDVEALAACAFSWSAHTRTDTAWLTTDNLDTSDGRRSNGGILGTRCTLQSVGFLEHCNIGTRHATMNKTDGA